MRPGSRTAEWTSRLLGRTRRQRLVAIAVVLLVSGGLGLAYAELTGPTGVMIALLVGALVVAWAVLTWPPLPRPPWDQIGWRSIHDTPIVCALCGFECLGGFYVEAPYEPGVYIHTISCGPAVNGMERRAEPTHEIGQDGRLRPKEA